MLRYGSVPYLNAKPLLDGLAEEVGPVRLEVPSRLVGLLRDGEIDVALAPVVAAFEDARLVVVPVGAVAARGPVDSVLLFCRVPPAEARVVALDTSSRTSSALTRVLFEHRFGARPRFVDRAPDPDLRGLDADAALLIGDPALRAVWDGPPPVDLGRAWTDWTALPFVFAVWLARDAATAHAAHDPLARAAQRGLADLGRIAAAGAADLSIPRDRAEGYLRHSLRFAFGPEEQAGLERFRSLWEGLRERS